MQLCSAECEGGVQTRFRGVAREGVNGGGCENKTEETRECNVRPCRPPPSDDPGVQGRLCQGIWRAVLREHLSHGCSFKSSYHMGAVFRNIYDMCAIIATMPCTAWHWL